MINSFQSPLFSKLKSTFGSYKYCRMLKIFIFTQVMLICNCLLDNRLPSTASPENFNRELTNIWKELASVKGQLLTATQERNSLQKLLTAANVEISALKVETSQCRKDIDELRRNQTQISEEVKWLNDSMTKRNADVAILTNEIGDLVQQQNTLHDAFHNTTVILAASVVSNQNKTSGSAILQSQFRSLQLDFKDLNRNISNLGLKFEDTVVVISAINNSLRQLQNSEGTIKNNTAAVSALRDNMTRYMKAVSGIQQQLFGK